jgi:hypothetical protein
MALVRVTCAGLCEKRFEISRDTEVAASAIRYVLSGE